MAVGIFFVVMRKCSANGGGSYNSEFTKKFTSALNGLIVWYVLPYTKNYFQKEL